MADNSTVPTNPNPFSALPNGIDISSHVNSMFVGIMFTPALWGITVTQTWIYYNANRDGWMLKVFVAILFLMDTASTCLTLEMAHFYLIRNFGSLATLQLLPITGIVEVAMNITTVFLVELFFAQRIYLLTQRRVVVPAIIVILAIAGIISGSFICSEIAKDPTVASLAKPSMKISTALCNVFEATSDLVAAIALSYEFYRSKGHIQSTNTLLDKLLGFTVGRGALVTVAQFLTLALYVAKPTSLDWMPVHFTLGKLCHITMIVILNSRDYIRRPKGTYIDSNDMGISETAVASKGATAHTPFQLKSLESGKGGLSGIHVHQEQSADYDTPKHRI